MAESYRDFDMACIALDSESDDEFRRGAEVGSRRNAREWGSGSGASAYVVVYDRPAFLGRIKRKARPIFLVTAFFPCPNLLFVPSSSLTTQASFIGYTSNRQLPLTAAPIQVMDRRKRWLGLAVFFCLITVMGAREIRVRPKDDRAVFNHTLATILVEYASAVYMSDLTELFDWTCPRCGGMTEGFEVVELIVDVQNCLQAYVGVSGNLNSIVIAFRGTQEHSIQNWIEDLFWKQLDIQYPGMPGAMVHRGFYYAYHNTTIRPAILSAVRRAKYMYGVETIMVTGHSMGGAMASFCGLDLAVNYGELNAQVLTFGQPRIGNAAFASYYSQFVPNTIRVTNGHDLVPHLPPYIPRLPQRTYHHFPREVWLCDVGLGASVYPTEKVCDGSGEDPSCSRSVTGNSLADHLEYYGVELMAETWGSCGIVWDPRWTKYGSKDLHGNILLSRNHATSPLKLPSESGAKLNII